MTVLISELKDLLGNESKDHWIKFMDFTLEQLPFLNGAGAPKKIEIENSIIGESGRKSWSEFVEKELSWNVHSWKAWKKAYLIVKKFPYLRDLGLTASEINVLNRENESFPANIEEFEALKSQRKAAIEQKKEASLSAVSAELASVKAENDVLNKKVVELGLELEKARKEAPVPREMIRPVEDKKSFLVPLVLSIVVNLGLIAALFAF